jgi:hypothetical protein
MFIHTKFPTLAVAAILALAVLAVLPRAAAAFTASAAWASLRQPACAASARLPEELIKLREDIAQAPSLDQAQSLALAPTDAALAAVAKARLILPFSQDLDAAQTRMQEQRSRIQAAATPSQVADEFSGMRLAGLDDDRLIHAKLGSHSCSYSSGETIAIVIGLILGIIPGLILLLVLC